MAESASSGTPLVFLTPEIRTPQLSAHSAALGELTADGQSPIQLTPLLNHGGESVVNGDSGFSPIVSLLVQCLILS